MRYIKPILCVMLFAVLTSCGKNSINRGAVLVQTGVLVRQGVTSYQYGSYLLLADTSAAHSAQYVLESTTIDLDPYLNQYVQVTANDVGSPTNTGPDLYNVTAIKLE